jgi:hypothetical protein
MSTRILRPRIAPLATFGLRRGRRRNSHMRWLTANPEAAAHLLEIIRQSRAHGYEPADMSRVREPFDYDRWRTTRSTA